jgi:hypothetical protein
MLVEARRRTAWILDALAEASDSTHAHALWSHQVAADDTANELYGKGK